MIVATNSYLEIGAFTVPLRKDSYRSSLHHLDLTTGATSRSPETAFPTISSSNVTPETVHVVHSAFDPATEATLLLGHLNWHVMAKVKIIQECSVKFSDTLSACATCKINMSTQWKHGKTSWPNLSSERIKLVSTDLLGYAYRAKYTGHHSRVKAFPFIEEPVPVLQTADSAFSQVRSRQLALQRQGSSNHNFASVSQYTKSVEMDKKKLYLFRYPTPTRNLWPRGRMLTFSDLCSKIYNFRTENHLSSNTLKSQLQF